MIPAIKESCLRHAYISNACNAVPAENILADPSASSASATSDSPESCRAGEYSCTGATACFRIRTCWTECVKPISSALRTFGYS